VKTTLKNSLKWIPQLNKNLLTTMIAYKLFRKRKDGTYGPLFINCKLKIKAGQWLQAESYPTKGFAVRPGWHCCAKPEAPHLSKKNRVWCVVDIWDYTPHQRPESQGGLWFTANNMKVLGEL
jgi:hypothetical protein